jgi:hypothetical protein
MKKLMTAAVTMLAALALLVPASSAQASQLTWTSWCEGPPGGAGQTLAQNKMCTGWGPLTIHSGIAFWHITKPGKGQVCLAVGNYQGSKFVPVSGGGWNCQPVQNIHSGGYDDGVNQVTVNNYFGAARGQLAILNLSSATILAERGAMYMSYYP